MSKRSKAKVVDFVQTPEAGKYASVYVRVSVRELDPELVKRIGEKEAARQSVKTQRADGLAACEARGWRVKVYDGDSDLSGTQGADVRKSLAALIADIRAGLVHHVVARDVSRLWRDNFERQRFVREVLVPHGVDILMTDEAGVNVSTTTGRLLGDVKGLMANVYLEELRAKSMRGREAAAVEGRTCIGGECYGYAVKGKGLAEVVEAEAQVVRRVHKMYQSGLGQTSIALRLNADGVPTKKGAARWSNPQVARILTNDRYVGRIKWKGALVPSPYPRILDDATWAATQKVWQARTQPTRADSATHLLGGLIECGCCLDAGRIRPTLVVGYGSSTAKPSTRYSCAHATREHGGKNCKGVAIPKHMADGFIREYLGAFLADRIESPAPARSLVEDAAKARERAAAVESRLAEIGDMFAAAEITREQFDRMSGKAGEKLAKARAEAAALEAKCGPDAAAAAREAIASLRKWDALDDAERKAAVRRAVERLALWPDRLELTIRGMDEKIVVPYAPPPKRNLRELPRPAEAAHVEVGLGDPIRAQFEAMTPWHSYIDPSAFVGDGLDAMRMQWAAKPSMSRWRPKKPAPSWLTDRSKSRWAGVPLGGHKGRGRLKPKR